MVHRDNKNSKKNYKPILLSIGYASCHWCHVMAHESFEDEATAKILNNKFINIEIKININPRATAISKFPFDVSNAIEVVITLVACAILPPTIIIAPTSDSDLPKPASTHVNNEYLESHKIVIILSLVFARKDFKSSSYSSVICSITCLVSETIIGVIKQN